MSAEKKYVVALDQGTTSSRAIVFDQDANIVGTSQREFTQHYPKAGWVEHDPMEIWATQSSVFTEVLAKTGLRSEEIAAIGIRVAEHTTMHGFALNCNNSLEPYETIIACGIRDAKTSTLSELLKREITPEMAAQVIQKHLTQIGKVTL